MKKRIFPKHFEHKQPLKKIIPNHVDMLRLNENIKIFSPVQNRPKFAVFLYGVAVTSSTLTAEPRVRLPVGELVRL